MVTLTSPHQVFPKSGHLAENLNLDLSTLRSLIPPQDTVVYGYIVDTVRHASGAFIQTGSGPNFEGDVVTLCTCKHQMRSGIAAAGWRGTWVAGFTGVGTVQGAGVNHVFYLMKVKQAYYSHRDAWNELPETTRLAKAADLHPLGDLYRPRGKSGDPFDPGSYEPPCAGHTHCNDWREDVDYVSRYGKRPPLLVGDPRFSFLWSRPLIAYPPPKHARTKKHELSGLLGRLRPA